jgi:hypothetical protein
VVQYADDTIIVMQGEEQQLLILKDILQKIALSSGLKVNYHKSCLVPINIDVQKWNYWLLLLDVWWVPSPLRT